MMWCETLKKDITFCSGRCKSCKRKGHKKVAFTNAEKIAADMDGLADLIYRADDVSPEICQMDYDENDNPINCKYQDTDKGCVKCIKEWLEQEVSEE